MQTLIDLLVLVSAALVAVSVVRLWGSPQSVRNLLFFALGTLVLAMLFVAAQRDDIADYVASVAYYLLCASVVAFAAQGIAGALRRGR